MDVRNVPVHIAGQRSELRDFLRSRRARLSPEDVGMPAVGRRRTPGLRREEVAVLAGVGVSWYTWLEQGRDIKVSVSVLDAISATLRLSAAEREHLYLLAGVNPPRRADRPSEPVTPELQRLLDGWLPNPAFILDRCWNIRTANHAAYAVFNDADGDDNRNCLVAFFTKTRFRAATESWEAAAATTVGQFRADAARYADDPRFAQLAHDLSAVSPEFAELWTGHEVHESIEGYKAVDDPDVGVLTFEYRALALPEWPGHRMVVFSPKPGTMTDARLGKLVAARRQNATGTPDLLGGPCPLTPVIGD